MARQLLEPILDNGLSNPHYFEGRLLTAAALREDQDAHRTRARHLGRALGAGVAGGLWVTLQSNGSSTSSPLVRVAAGLAVNGGGQTLELPSDEVVALARATDPPPAGTGLFRTCEPPAAHVEGPGEGFYVLTLAPASGFRGRAPASGLSDPTAGAGCGSRWAVEGVRFRLLPLDPLKVSGLSEGTKQLLEDELLGATGEAPLARLRNVVAHLCLGTEALGGFASDPFAREALPSGGMEAALADYGALDDLLDAGTLTECDVPLALVHWRVEGVVFADNWAVRRRLAAPPAAASWPTLSGGRRRAEAEAVLFQFQEQLGAVIERAANPAAIRAREYFRWLPPVGLAPMTGGVQEGVAAATFLDGLKTRDPAIHIDGARLAELLALSLAEPPVDAPGEEFLWTYRVRQNDLLPAETGPRRPYLVFASGHLPYVGTARFDLARWERSNFGLL
jgi:hypothetical protein